MTPDDLSAIKTIGSEVVEALNDPYTRIATIVSAIAAMISAIYSARSSYASQAATKELIAREMLPQILVKRGGPDDWIGIDPSKKEMAQIDVILWNVGRGFARDLNISLEGIRLCNEIDFLFSQQDRRVQIPQPSLMKPEYIERLNALMTEQRDELTLTVEYSDEIGKKYERKIKLQKHSIENIYPVPIQA